MTGQKTSAFARAAAAPPISPPKWSTWCARASFALAPCNLFLRHTSASRIQCEKG